MTNLDVSYNKCLKVIQSVTKYEHFIAVENYINNFSNYYNIEQPNDMIDMFQAEVFVKMEELSNQ